MKGILCFNSEKKKKKTRSNTPGGGYIWKYAVNKCIFGLNLFAFNIRKHISF